MNYIKTTTFSSSNNYLDYFLIYLLISLSGNKVFNEIFLIFTFILAAWIFFLRKKTFDKFFLFFISILIIILGLQAIKFDFLSIPTVLGILLRFFTAYLIIKDIGPSFIEKFIKTMLVIALVSLFFYFLSIVIPNFIHFIKPFAFLKTETEVGKGIIQARYFTGLHTFYVLPYSDFKFTRNFGPFWEAGAFGGYLILTLLFYIVKNKKIFDKFGMIFIITIITTFSTTAYIALFLLIFFHLLSTKKYAQIKWLAAPFLLIILIFFAMNLGFVGEKIKSRIELAQKAGIVRTKTSSRFVDAIRDFKAFRGYELIGRGNNKVTRYSKLDKASGYTIRTNGFTDFMVSYGLIIFTISFFLIYKSFLCLTKYFSYNKKFAIYALLIIVILLQSEIYFGYPLFMSLLFLSAIYRKKGNQ